MHRIKYINAWLRAARGTAGGGIVTKIYDTTLDVCSPAITIRLRACALQKIPIAFGHNIFVLLYIIFSKLERTHTPHTHTQMSARNANLNADKRVM